MALTMEDYTCLEKVLLEAFPSYESLEQMVLHQLGENLEARAGRGKLETVIFNLIHKWAIPQGRLPSLVAGALKENPGNQKLQQVCLYILFDQAGFSNDELHRFYLQAMPEHTRGDPDSQYSGLRGMIYRLSQMSLTYPDNRLPIITFASLAKNHDKGKSIASTLEEWMKAVATSFGLSEAAVERALKAIPPAIVHHTVLWVLIEPATLDHSSYNIRIYSVAGNLFEICYKGQELELNQVPGALLTALNSLAAIGDDLHDLRIEFFLPFDLLTQAVDQYELPLPGMPLKLCSKHLVVVRPLERVDNQYMYTTCKSKWALLNEGDIEQQIRHVTITSHRRLPASLAEMRRLLEPKLCVGLYELPDQVITTSELLGKMIGMGIPIIIWLRQASRANRLISLVRRRGLSRLPESVHEERVAGCQGNPHHLGNHLALMWDDPNQHPPREILKSI